MWGDASCSTETGRCGGAHRVDMGRFKLQRLSPSPTSLIMALGTLANYSHSNSRGDSVEHYDVLDTPSSDTCQSRPCWPHSVEEETEVQNSPETRGHTGSSHQWWGET